MLIVVGGVDKMKNIILRQGLVYKDVKVFGGLLKKANISQLIIMAQNINAELENRADTAQIM